MAPRALTASGGLLNPWWRKAEGSIGELEAQWPLAERADILKTVRVLRSELPLIGRLLVNRLESALLVRCGGLAPQRAAYRSFSDVRAACQTPRDGPLGPKTMRWVNQQ